MNTNFNIKYYVYLNTNDINIDIILFGKILNK